MARKQTLNDDDRAQWVDNDEGLYDMWRSSRLSKREFIRRKRHLRFGTASVTCASSLPCRKHRMSFIASSPSLGDEVRAVLGVR